MENEELIRRAEDLSAKCIKTGEVTGTFFLTPAEQQLLGKWALYGTDCTVVFTGGRPECERKAAFFLPYYMDENELAVQAHICCVRIKAGFGEPGHRDYLGAVLGLGIRREWIGDIWIYGDTAYLFCLPTITGHLTASLDKVGRFGVKTAEIALTDAPAPEIETKRVAFTVKSPRLDAVLSGMFSVSRTSAAKLIEAGMASLNYLECLKTDAEVKEGDVVSLRGYGKGTVSAFGGMSKKGRMFIETDIFI